MQASFSKLKEPQVRAIDHPLSYKQEISVLNLLNDGIFVAYAGNDEIDPSDFEICYANVALTKLCGDETIDLLHRSVTNLFPLKKYGPFHDALRQVVSLETSQNIELAYNSGAKLKQLRISLTPYWGDPLGEHKTVSIDGRAVFQVIGTVTDVTDLTTRASYLEDRAVKLIDHANGLETSRRQLEKELAQLQRMLNAMERSAHFDLTTGLPNRSHFLERGAAEFQRSNRYQHDLSAVVVSVQGYKQIIEAHGQDAGDAAMTGLSQVCESAYRNGADIAGRIGNTEIAIILPETNFSGALQFIDRLRALIASTPLQIGNGFVRLGLVSGVDTVQSEDRTFMQCLTRAQNAQAEI